jgi:hypothetical protein
MIIILLIALLLILIAVFLGWYFSLDSEARRAAERTRREMAGETGADDWREKVYGKLRTGGDD